MYMRYGAETELGESAAVAGDGKRGSECEQVSPDRAWRSAARSDARSEEESYFVVCRRRATPQTAPPRKPGDGRGFLLTLSGKGDASVRTTVAQSPRARSRGEVLRMTRSLVQKVHTSGHRRATEMARAGWGEGPAGAMRTSGGGCPRGFYKGVPEWVSKGIPRRSTDSGTVPGAQLRGSAGAL